MTCNITTEKLIETINELTTNSEMEKGPVAARALIEVMQKTANMDSHFEVATSSKSKLDEYSKTTKTPIAKVVEGLLEDAARGLKVDTKFDMSLRTNEGSDNYQGWQSVIGYLVDHSGELNEKAKEAMALVGAEWLANDATETLASRRDDNATKGMLGLDQNSTLAQEQRDIASEIDGLVNKTANSLGAKVYKLLGIKAKADTDILNNSRIADTLKTELGLMVLKALELNGALTLEKKEVKLKRKGSKHVQTETWNVYNVAKSAKAVDAIGLEYISLNGVVAEQYKKELGQQLDKAEGEGSVRGVYLTKEQAVPIDSNIVNEGPTGKVSAVSLKHKEAVKKQSGTANWLNKGYVKALQALDNDGKYLRKLLGYVEPTTVLKVRETAVKGKNQMIDKAIEDLNNIVTSVGFGNSMYGRWKVITNNRFMLDSNTFNWQDKKLHRFAVDRGTSTVSTDLQDTNGKMLLLALAQAFDLDIDKKRFSTVLKEVNKLVDSLQSKIEIDSTDKTLDEYQDTNEYGSNVKIIVEALVDGGHGSEIEHMLRGAVELVNLVYTQEKGEDTYDTGIMIETDAITSGYAIKGLQFPIYADKEGKPFSTEQILSEIQKVGIFNGTGNYGDRVESGEKDAYETPASVLGEKLKGKPATVVKLLDPKAKVGKDGAVSISRSFMKQPFMTLNYGSGVKGILNDALNTAEENFYDMVQEYVNTRDAKVRVQLNSTIVALFGRNSDVARKVNQKLAFKLSKKEQERMRVTLDRVINKPLEATLKEEYKHFIDLSGTLNSSFRLRFQLAKSMIDSKIAEEFDKRAAKVNGSKNLVPPLNRAEMEKILEDVHSVLPVFDTPLAVDKDGKKAEGLIAKLERVHFNNSNSAVGNVAVTGKVRIEGAGKLDNAALELYELVESATGGAVLPIHFFDGSIQAEVLSEFNALGVHDANYGTLDDVVEITKFYNEKFYELNKSYSLAKEVLDGMLTSIEKADDSALNSVKKDELVDTLNEVASVYFKAKAVRTELFSKDLTIQHAYFEGPEGFAEFDSKDSKVEGNSSTDAKIKNRINEALKVINSSSTSAKTMAEDANIAVKDVLTENENRAKEDPKGCN